MVLKSNSSSITSFSLAIWKFWSSVVILTLSQYNEPSGVNSESGTTENSYILRYLGKSMSGRVLEATRSLFINYIY